MEILNAEQMRRVDARTIEEYGIPGATLMENAGAGICERLLDDLPGLSTRPVRVLCGKGNNGGDGWVIARHLHHRAIPVVAVSAVPFDDLSGDAKAMHDEAAREGVDVVDGSDPAAWKAVSDGLADGGWVVDALLGTGIRGGARGRIAEWIRTVRVAGAPVVAVDLPSGMDADGGPPVGEVLPARRTYTLCRPKPGLIFGEGAALCGDWSVVPIGIPDDAVAAEASRWEWFDRVSARRLVRPRPPESHKGTFGHVLIVAGSPGKAGAAALAGRGGLRGGAGLVTIATPRSIRAEVASMQPEWMTEGLAENPEGGISPTAVDAVLEWAAQFQPREGEPARASIVLGPGLGRSEGTRAFAEAILSRSPLPMVVDADGLGGLREGTPLPAPRVLTPHPGEAARLLSTDTPEVQDDRRAALAELRRRYRATVVLKGRHTLVGDDGGRGSVNSTGNPGLASAGTGDVLAGLLGAMLCRGLAAFDAARLAVFVHGDAGDRAARRWGEEGMIASDTAEAIAPALKGLSGARE